MADSHLFPPGSERSVRLSEISIQCAVNAPSDSQSGFRGYMVYTGEGGME